MVSKRSSTRPAVRVRVANPFAAAPPSPTDKRANGNSLYVVARGASGKALLMHAVSSVEVQRTKCAHDMTGWEREFTTRPLHAILCKLPGCRA